MQHLEVELRAQAKALMPLDRRMIHEESLQRFLLVYGHGQRVQRLEGPQRPESTGVALAMSVWPCPSVHGEFANQLEVVIQDSRSQHVEVPRRPRIESIFAEENPNSFLFCPFA